MRIRGVIVLKEHLSVSVHPCVRISVAGSFGCLADCGAYRQQLLSQVNVQLQAAYTANALTTAALQASFLAQTSWNLCFESNDTGVPTERCWFEAEQRFSSVKEYVNRTLLLPDADWALVVRAPLGSVTALVTLLPQQQSGGNGSGSAAAAPRVLTYVSRCKAREI